MHVRQANLLELLHEALVPIIEAWLLTAQVASRLNQLRDTNLRPR